jgi:endonuclease-3 related protein
MPAEVNFRRVFLLLKDWFDRPTPAYQDFDAWRQHTYAEVSIGARPNLPLKTWWPQYTTGDFRLELCLGALLVPQVSWPQVRVCLENLRDGLTRHGVAFDVSGLLRLLQEPEPFARLIKASRFPHQKREHIRTLCTVLQATGGVERFFRQAPEADLGAQLQRLKSGFGPETRDCVLLYAANVPVFIADTYARTLLTQLQLTERGNTYAACQRLWQQGMRRDFTAPHLDALVQDYTREELQYALCNTPPPAAVPWVLLYQQWHAGIVELGLSGRWDDFIAQLHHSS